MRHVIALLLLAPTIAWGQSDFYKKVLRRATFYAAVNGGNSVSDQDVYSVATGALETGVIKTRLTTT